MGRLMRRGTQVSHHRLRASPSVQRRFQPGGGIPAALAFKYIAINVWQYPRAMHNLVKTPCMWVMHLVMAACIITPILGIGNNLMYDSAARVNPWSRQNR